MGTLGDFFPADARNEFVTRHLKPGQVLYLECHFTTPPKEKYVVLVAASDKPGPLLFLINSRIHPYIMRRAEMLACQVKLSAAQYSFLEHDCFIDCSRVIEEFDYQNIRQQLLQDVTRVRGELDAQAKAMIVQVVQASRTVSPYHKRLLIQALQSNP